MAYIEITQALISNSYASNAAGTFSLLNPNGAAYPFSSSAYNGTTYLASQNLGVNSSASEMRLQINSTGSSGMHLKIEYLISSETNYDYGMFGNSGVSIASSTTYDSSNLYKHTRGETYTATTNSIEYFIPMTATFVDIVYRKDVNTDSGWDRLMLRIYTEAISGGGTSPSTPYFWVGARFMLNGYRNNINRTYMIGASLRSQTKIALSDSLVTLTDTVSTTQMTASGVPGTYFWISGQSASFADISPTTPYTTQLPINFSADTIGHVNLGTHTVTMTVITGMTAASVRTNITGTLTATPFTTLTVQQLTWDATVMGKNGSSSNYKAYFDINFGSPINKTYQTGKSGYVRLRTSAITITSNVTVTANRAGSESSTGTLGANTSVSFKPSSASSTEPIVTIGDLSSFDGTLATNEFGSELTKCVAYDNSSHFDSRLGSAGRLMHMHDFLAFTGTPDYFKDETQEGESYTTSFSWDAGYPSSTILSVTNWTGSSGNWRAEVYATGTTLAITGITTGYQTTLYTAAFDFEASGLGSQQNYEDKTVALQLEFLDSSNTVLRSEFCGYCNGNETFEVSERTITFSTNQKPVKVRPVYYMGINSSAPTAGVGQKCAVTTSTIYGTGITTIQS